ncbi:MAG: protein-disulfide reductase DsbD domain-containing protein, partial [Planctomycetota bacterium]
YWKGRNDSGLFPEVRLALPEGYSAGEVLWPAPHRKISPGNILDHVYTKRAVLLIPVRIPESARGGPPAGITATLEWMTCREACVPESGSVSAVFPVGREAESASGYSTSQDAAILAEAVARTPAPLPNSVVLHAEWRERILDIRLDEAEALAFYPGTDCTDLIDPIRDAAGESDRLELEFAKTKDSELRVRGVLEVRFAGSGPPRFFKLDITGPASG